MEISIESMHIRRLLHQLHKNERVSNYRFHDTKWKLYYMYIRVKLKTDTLNNLIPRR